MSVKFFNLKGGLLQETSSNKYPLFHFIKAGFPSPADDYLESKLSLDELIIKNPPSTFFVRVEGFSMIDSGIYPNDILVVDKSLTAKINDVIVALLDGDFTVKRFIRVNGKYFLKSENKGFQNIPIDEHSNFIVWGVVTYVIHKPIVL